MKNKSIILASLLACVIMPAVSFAGYDSTEEFTPRSKKIFLEPEQSFLAKGKFRFIVAETAGFDTNTDLNSKKTGDAFMQTYFKAGYAASVSEKTEFKAEYDMMSLLYASESYMNLIRNGARLGLEYKLSKDFLLSTGYRFGYVDYLNSGSDDYLDNSVEFKLTQQLPDKLFHSIGYDSLYRYYDSRYTRTTAGVETNKPRGDWRNTLSYEIGKYLKKDLIKFNVGYYNNNSSDPYLKYYDYDSYKLGTSWTHLFNNKWSGLVSYSKQYRDYRSRTLINDGNATEFERSDLASAAVFYAPTKALSFGLNYTYRQNHSNEPIDKYSGSIISLSTYYKF